MKKPIFAIAAMMVLSLAFFGCKGGGGDDTYAISGIVTLNGSGYEGITVTLSGDADDTATTDASGTFVFEDLPGGAYTVTPSLAGQTFSPEDRGVAIADADVTDQDFALDTYALSGQVSLNGEGYDDATLTLGGDADDTAASDASGNYSFTGLLNGTYTVTPAVIGQSLTPASLADIVVAGADSTGNDFALDTYAISGQVTNGLGAMEGIEVGLTGDLTDAAATDASGNYAFTGLLNGSYTITPVAAPQTFDPASSFVSVSYSDEENVDFAVPSMIWLVDINAAAATQDGYTWPTAFRHPQSGSDMAAPGEQVWVAQGSYASMDSLDSIMPVLVLDEGAAYYGGFTGTETSVDERDPAANPTVLDGLDFTEQIVVAADGSVLSGFVVTGANVPLDAAKAPVNAADVSDFTLIDCLVTGNTTATGGTLTGSSGLSISGSVQVVNSIFTSNTGKNGPIYVLRGNTEPVDIINTLIWGNNSWYGGGMVLGGTGRIRVLNSTIHDNYTTQGGEGVWIDQGGWQPEGDVEITNCIVYGDIGGYGGTPGETWTLPVVTYSNLQSLGAEYDALWSAPGDNNLFGWPDFIDAANQDYHLASNSQCIDAGNNDAVLASILTDVAGITRIMDGDGDLEATVDMGAYEFVPAE